MNQVALHSLREEIAHLNDYIEGLPDELKDGPYGAAYKDRLQMLCEQELLASASHLRLPTMDLRAENQSTSTHRIAAGLLGKLLQNWQRLLSALGQANAGETTTRGVIPAEIRSQTSLDVVAFSPGSFVARLALTPQADQSHLVQGETMIMGAYRLFQELVSVKTPGRDLEAMMHKLGSRVVSRYSSLLELLDQSGTSLRIVAAAPDGERVRRAQIANDTAHSLLPQLAGNGLIEHEGKSLIPGILGAANRRTGKFEIDIGDEGTISGRVPDPRILDGHKIGEAYLFEVVESVSRDRISGDFSSSHTLVGIGPIQDDYSDF